MAGGLGVQIEVSASEVTLFIVFVFPVGKSASHHQEFRGFLHGLGDVTLGADRKGIEIANGDFNSNSANIGELGFESGFALVRVGHAQKLGNAERNAKTFLQLFLRNQHNPLFH
jgi:hypothetical protein